MVAHPLEVTPCKDNLIGNLSSVIAKVVDKNKDLGDQYVQLYNKTCGLQEHLRKARKELKLMEDRYKEADKEMEEVKEQMMKVDNHIHVMKKAEEGGKNETKQIGRRL